MPGEDGVPIDDDLNEVDEYVDRPIDRFIQSVAGEMTGAAMTGFAKALGWDVKPEPTAVVREAGAPPRDDDDPIEVSIDPDHPENSRIVFHVHPTPNDEATED